MMTLELLFLFQLMYEKECLEAMVAEQSIMDDQEGAGAVQTNKSKKVLQYQLESGGDKFYIVKSCETVKTIKKK